MTSMTRTIVTDPLDPRPDAGVRAARARQRRLYVVIAALAAAGFVVGFFSSMFERDGGGFLEGIGPVWAVAASLILVVAIVWGTRVYMRHSDELERRNNSWGLVVAGNFFLIGYPVWFLLWRGELVPEPDHQIVYVATVVVMMLAYFWKKVRP